MILNNAVALVTGANRGLGIELVKALKKAGVKKIYAASRQPIASNDDTIIPVTLDVTNESHISNLLVKCSDVNLLINNAGLMTGTPAISQNATQALKDEFSVNVLGVTLLMNTFSDVIEKNGGGNIVNMLSVVSWYSWPFNATYGATKRAAMGVTDGARIQLKERGIKVSGVYAGFIDTDMAAEVDAPKVSAKDVADEIIRGISCDADHIYADNFSRTIFNSMFSNPEGIQKQMLDAWNNRNQLQ